MSLPSALQSVIDELGKLPGIGRRSAERIAFGLLASPNAQTKDLAQALLNLHTQVGNCSICGYFTDHGTCPICSDNGRDRTSLCVVEQALDVVAFERAGGFRGQYHVLAGVLSPLKGVTPDDLRISELYERLAEGEFTEIILATSPSVEGDATALFLSRQLDRPELSVTRIGKGIPMGGSLEHADGGTLRMALEGRRAIK